MKALNKLFVSVVVLGGAVLAGCQAPPVADVCGGRLGTTLDAAVRAAESRLSMGCEYSFDTYFNELMALAEDNPDADNKRVFSDFLVHAKDSGVISTRQAQERYNRYFNVRFVSLHGDYNTCSQTCPVRNKVMADMKRELADKELGLLRVSTDQASFYRADGLFKETQLVLEATCRACEAGGAR